MCSEHSERLYTREYPSYSRALIRQVPPSHAGLPYGAVNLRHGVPPHETPVSATATGGTVLLEFGLLSHLSGDGRCTDRPVCIAAARSACIGIECLLLCASPPARGERVRCLVLS